MILTISSYEQTGINMISVKVFTIIPSLEDITLSIIHPFNQRKSAGCGMLFLARPGSTQPDRRGRRVSSSRAAPSINLQRRISLVGWRCSAYSAGQAGRRRGIRSRKAEDLGATLEKAGVRDG